MSVPNEAYRPAACDGLASLRVLLSVASTRRIRELLGHLADRADEAEMIQPLAVQPHISHRGGRRAFRAFPPIGRFIHAIRWTSVAY
jgi:hypothetical protein